MMPTNTCGALKVGIFWKGDWQRGNGDRGDSRVDEDVGDVPVAEYLSWVQA